MPRPPAWPFATGVSSSSWHPAPRSRQCVRDVGVGITCVVRRHDALVSCTGTYEHIAFSALISVNKVQRVPSGGLADLCRVSLYRREHTRFGPWSGPASSAPGVFRPPRRDVATRPAPAGPRDRRRARAPGCGGWGGGSIKSVGRIYQSVSRAYPAISCSILMYLQPSTPGYEGHVRIHKNIRDDGGRHTRGARTSRARGCSTCRTWVTSQISCAVPGARSQWCTFLPS